MKYVLGIDGGGTKTVLKIADVEGCMLAELTGGPTNVNAEHKENVQQIIGTLILNGLQKAEVKLEDCAVICFGAAGAGRNKEKTILAGMIRDTGFQGKLLITDDAQTALYGGVGCGEGIILVSGTGSICYGRNSKGESHRAGGWGHLIGDEGSGYYIGIRILTHIMKSFDDRETSGLLTSMLLKHLGLSNPEALIEYVYRSGAGKKEIADLARFADEAYMLGDKAAETILADAAFELFCCARAVIGRLKFSTAVSMAISGGVLNNSEAVKDKLSALVTCSYPLIKIVKMKSDAAWGAVLIALDEIGERSI